GCHSRRHRKPLFLRQEDRLRLQPMLLQLLHLTQLCLSPVCRRHLTQVRQLYPARTCPLQLRRRLLDPHAPNTNAPETAAPDTSVPHIIAPGTNTPVALTRETGAPGDEPSAPAAFGGGNLTEEERKVGKMGEESPVAQVSEGAESVYPAVVAAGVVSTSANPGGLASRLLLVTAGCHVKGEDQDLPRAFHPTGVSVDGSQALGMVLGNFALMAVFSTICYLVLKFAQVAGERAFPKLFEGLDTQGLMRLPSAPLMVFTFLYQGTTFGAVMLLMEPPHPIGFCAGVFSFVLCAAVPMGVFYRMHRSVPAKAVYLLDDVYKGKIWAFVIGPGEWVSVQRKNHWVNRYASVMRTYRQETVWFSLVEFCSMFALAAVSATRVESVTACGHVKLFSAMIFFVQLGAE
ncbi:hypothetical protein DIPPA_06378, partial [Diplonema papillatum]